MSKDVNPSVKEGDNIILIYMKDPYSPVPGGTKGVVNYVSKDPFDEGENIISVDWENGSQLSLVSSEDIWMMESDLKTNIKEASNSNLDSLVAIKDIFKYSDEKIFFDFLSKIRESGIVNMLESGQFLFSGPKYLQKFIEFEEMKSGREYDEDMVKELMDMSQKTRDEFIRMAMKIVIDEGTEDYSTSNLEKKIRALTRQALIYYIKMFN
jgi:hypothetical protein|tara:strand:- start:3948 stop:4577 length:630 start_codon:yes stop_codon:yes gene_type:complete